MSLLLSMTGYASVQGSLQGESRFTLTLKSVNHRFLDLSLRLPPQCDALEIQVRRVLKEQLKRGHVDVTLQVNRKSMGLMHLNADVLDAYIQAYRSAAELHGIEAKPDLNVLLRIPGVMSTYGGVSDEDLAGLEAGVKAELGSLIEKLNEVRAQEGAMLGAELRRSMGRLDELAMEVDQLRIGIRSAQFERLRTRMAEFLNGVGVNEDRLIAEAALLAERSDIDEEVVRLRTHIGKFVAILDEGGEVGKRLDFLLQELNREANTMLSKTSGATGSNGMRITELGLEMKAEIERSREQVQNLE